MHHHQSDSDSSDDSMKHPAFMTSTMESQRHRRSMDKPTEELSDITHLQEEFYRLHEEISPECKKHIKKMTDVVNEFEKDYRHASCLIDAGIAGLVLGLALAAFTGGASLIAGGLGLVVGIAAGGAAAGGGIACGIGEFSKNQQEKMTRLTIEKELEEFQYKISPIIKMVVKIYDRTQEILRDPTLSEHKANVLRERFSSCFEKTQFFQRDSSRAAGARKQLTGDLSETFAEMSSVLTNLEEITEDKEEQDDNDNPEETPAQKQIEDKEFKKKAEKFIDEMKKGINQLQNVMNEIDQTKQRLLKK
ncbi:uncharacterized protein LOC109093909 [Cyprinus carpio]|uniref:Uncharacterized protein LOC109093909 n=1 Tax=Cyprinus carpio TaxID=7962 RepID=A0A9Q9VCV8_CYPCA|nr:uncharacterized protein LOC109093909 [Cyprinus carpio]